MKFLIVAIPFVVSARNMRRLEEAVKTPEGGIDDGRASGRFYINAYKDKDFDWMPELDLDKFAGKLEPLGYMIDPIWDKAQLAQIPGMVLTKEYRLEPIVPPPLPRRPPRQIPVPVKPVREYVKDVSDIDMFKQSRFFIRADDFPDLMKTGHVSDAWEQLSDKFHSLGEPLAEKLYHQYDDYLPEMPELPPYIPVDPLQPVIPLRPPLPEPIVPFIPEPVKPLLVTPGQVPRARGGCQSADGC